MPELADGLDLGSSAAMRGGSSPPFPISPRLASSLIAFIVDLVTMWGIRVPLAVILPKIANLGVYGIRWALVADTVSSAIVFIIYFKSGRWKHRKV